MTSSGRATATVLLSGIAALGIAGVGIAGLGIAGLGIAGCCFGGTEAPSAPPPPSWPPSATVTCRKPEMCSENDPRLHPSEAAARSSCEGWGGTLAIGVPCPTEGLLGMCVNTVTGRSNYYYPPMTRDQAFTGCDNTISGNRDYRWVTAPTP